VVFAVPEAGFEVCGFRGCYTVHCRGALETALHGAATQKTRTYTLPEPQIELSSNVSCIK
jgi:hypothetical protein